MIKKYQLILCIVIVAIGCTRVSKDTRVKFELVKDYIDKHLDETIRLANQLAEKKEKSDLIDIFEQTRAEYKKTEPFLNYYLPRKTHGVNGPPLPVYKEDSDKILPAIGFQAIEEQLYTEEEIDSALYNFRVKILLGYLETIKTQFEPIPITPRRFFVPIHQQFLSIFSLGIISFDTPTSLRGLEESIISLESIKETYMLAISDTIQVIDPTLNKEFIANIEGAISYLRENDDFEVFDRYSFTRDHINKLTRNWRDIRKATNLLDAPESVAINLDAPTFFEENSFRADFFTGFKTKPSDEQVLLGKKLFFEPKLSASGSLSCATCHQPENAYQDGLVLGKDKEGKSLKRNTPTIINTIFQQKYFWDGRSDNLIQQINSVFDNEAEFGRSLSHELSILDLEGEEYDTLFAQVFPDTKEISRRSVIRAITAYVSTLNAFNSRFDKNLRGELDDFTKEEVLGMNLYMGKALCATCHFLPLTSGTVPPNLKETEKEIIGTPETAENKEVDDDLGFYWVYKAAMHKNMFKTPTIRNIDLTAPYMHNGVYETLEQVMDFYNKGGGAGMGFDLPYQTLPFDSLNLNEEEQQAIIAFMKTFTDQPEAD